MRRGSSDSTRYRLLGLVCAAVAATAGCAPSDEPGGTDAVRDRAEGDATTEGVDAADAEDEASTDDDGTGGDAIAAGEGEGGDEVHVEDGGGAEAETAGEDGGGDSVCPEVPVPAGVSDQPITGEEPFGRHETTRADGFDDDYLYEDFDSPGGWAAMQDDALGYGVGIYYENRLTTFQAWQLRSLPFNNVRARFSFGLAASGTVRARAYLVLGSYATIAGRIDWLDDHLAPFGVLDDPAADAVATGSVPVHGWALDNKGVASVSLVVDGGTAIPLSYGVSRPDVCLVWPGYAGCDAVGYAGTLEASTLSPCGHVLEVRATDTDGNERVIAARRIFVGG